MTSIIHPDQKDPANKYQWAIDGLKQLGIPVVFSAILLWFVLSRVDNVLSKIAETLDTHAFSQDKQDIEVNRNAVEVKSLMLSIERLNQRVCFNTARTDAQKNECYK